MSSPWRMFLGNLKCEVTLQYNQCLYWNDVHVLFEMIAVPIMLAFKISSSLRTYHEMLKC